MGVEPAIDFDKFPKQGNWLGCRTRVLFLYRGEPIMGTIVRDDREKPYRTIIKLDDGRHILGDECQHSPEINNAITN